MSQAVKQKSKAGQNGQELSKKNWAYGKRYRLLRHVPHCKRSVEISDIHIQFITVQIIQLLGAFLNALCTAHTFN